MEISWDFVKEFDKTPVFRKLACFLATGGFNYFKRHTWYLLCFLLHSAIMLSVVNILLKREVGGHSLNSH